MFDLTTVCACPDKCDDKGLIGGGVAAGVVGIVLMVLWVGPLKIILCHYKSDMKQS